MHSSINGHLVSELIKSIMKNQAGRLQVGQWIVLPERGR